MSRGAHLPDPGLIDLTLSDDDSSDQTPQTFSKLSASQMLDALPVSNHGLPLPYSADSVNARAPPRFPAATRISGAYTRGAISLGRRELSAVNVENPAKRRKTHGGVPSGQSIRTTTSQASQNNEFQINLVLKRQVFPHIKVAVAQCQQRLSDEERAEVGEKTAGFLVKDPGFIKNFVANGLKLGIAYENDLAHRAKTMVDQYAREIFLVSITPRLPRDISTGASKSKEMASNNQLSRQNSTQTTRSNSTASEAAGEIFEHPPILPKQTSMSTNSRKYSSSPTTSFSHDALDLGNSVDSNSRTPGSSRQKTRPQPATRRRSGRKPVVLIQSATSAQTKDSSEILHPEASAASRPYVRNRPPDPPISRPRPSILSQLSSREFLGLAPPSFNTGQGSFKEKVTSCLEDNLTRISEWTDCCGDIAAISWTSDDTFVCGAVAHSDFHNMQYNKPGNLGVGSLSFDTLKAIPDHRIVRPLIGTAENAENALESMRRTQDPWLYTSVVSSSHNEANGFTFTASFDKTVKVWSVANDGSTLDLRATWEHDNKVNFVVCSEHHDRVATAADVCNDAIRVYNFDELDISNSPYDTYSGERAREQAQEIRRRDTWAYFPATMQWGKAPIVANYLLVGYSPRSINGHDIDIPEDKRNTGEICIWDVEDMSRVAISSAHSQNVFELIWHPTQPFFIAATSPTGHFESDTRTQVRLFARKGLGAFFHLKTLDCPALDINELTMIDIHSYVTASCTDGNTYVWDTARHNERPIHVLNHGDSLDNPLPDLPREIGDEGVKFASWGRSSKRFYTGSSDGRLKAWNIHEAPGNALVRHVLEVSGGISVGAFSRDFSKLLVGDATGKVHLLAYDDSDLDEDEESSETDERPTFSPVSGSGALRKAFAKRPKVIIPHPEPPPPLQSRGESFSMENLEKSAQELSLEFLVEGRLRLHPDPAIGVVQGPNYAETKLFRPEAHQDGDISKPLLPEFEAKQQYEKLRNTSKIKFSKLPTVQCSDLDLHARNEALDLALEKESVDFDFDYGFEGEPTPHFAIFGNMR
ncbi:Rik1-associated factor [Lachnellula willkommii]|uniref:Rik1-associated factor n=1 Tax=Lachnellula willkommii TaxID=215461 RepID=A0A559MLC3_9HELO|nr:Rik1-associated factor [Lachnellula willkommii]